MSRPPLPVGTWGRISRTETPRGSGRWRATARFRGLDGRTRQREAWGPSANKAEQRLVAALRESAALGGIEISPETRLSGLVEFCLEDLEATDKVSEQTLRIYTDAARAIVVPGVGELMIREATTSRLDRFLKAVAKKTPGRVRHVRVILSGMLSLAVRHDALIANPVHDLSVIKIKRKPVRAPTVEDLNAFRKAIQSWQDAPGKRRPQDLLDVIDVMAGTGARIGEVLALRWSDLDLGADRPSATINGTLVQLKGKGVVWQEHPKTDAGRRTVYLPRFTVETFMRVQLNAQPNPYDVIFPSSTGTLRSPSNFGRQWRNARADTGFEWVTPHSFRKTVATLLDRERGTKDAASQLGHSGVAVTEAHYVQKTHTAPDMTEVLEALAPRRESSS